MQTSWQVRAGVLVAQVADLLELTGPGGCRVQELASLLDPQGDDRCHDMRVNQAFTVL